jgi:hypothetical protein
VNEHRQFADLSIIHVLTLWTFAGTTAFVAWQLTLALAR